MRFHVPPFVRSFYFLSAAAFAAWMVFFDSNDFVTQLQRRRKLAELEEERDYYKAKIGEVEKERDALLNNPDLLEKFARERYLMKRPRETVFVTVRDTADKAL